MSLKDKVIVITGAASGIGLETARLFASKGAKLSLADVQTDRLQELHSELRATYPEAQVMAMTVDVSKRSQVEDWITKTVDTYGKLDGCANLAGVIGKQSNVVPIENVDDDDWDFIYSVNVIGLRNCLRAQVPHMNAGGSIVNASSILGLIGAANNLAYASSKHAIIGMTRVAAKELGPRKIRCNCFCPYVYKGVRKDILILANCVTGDQLIHLCCVIAMKFWVRRWITAFCHWEGRQTRRRFQPRLSF